MARGTIRSRPNFKHFTPSNQFFCVPVLLPGLSLSWNRQPRRANLTFLRKSFHPLSPALSRKRVQETIPWKII